MSSPTSNSDAQIIIDELGAHCATVDWHGNITQGGAAKFVKTIDNLFGYYMYQRIHVVIESPGGQIHALDYMLRAVDRWKNKGRSVVVTSNFECASAAALFLSYGKWGERKVDKQTTLVYHASRFDPRAMRELTAVSSSRAAMHMNDIDVRIVDHLMAALLNGAGSRESLANLILKRIQYVDANWKDLCEGMSSLTSSACMLRKPRWIKDIMKIASTENQSRFFQSFSQNLSRRFEADTRMDLMEAYSLCLIDEINEVVSDRSLNDNNREDTLESELQCISTLPHPSGTSGSSESHRSN